MEQLMSEIEAFAASRGVAPGTVVQYATGHGGTTWDRWKAGGSCSVTTAEKIRAYIARHERAGAA